LQLVWKFGLFGFDDVLNEGSAKADSRQQASKLIDLPRNSCELVTKQEVYGNYWCRMLYSDNHKQHH